MKRILKFGVLAVCCIFIYIGMKMNAGCTEKGGVLVQGLFGVACVAKQ